MVAHDFSVPHAGQLFQPVQDHYGIRLALVFGNHAPGGICPYARTGHCHHCDIGFGEGMQFDAADNLKRLAWYRTYYADILPQVAHLVIYNSGSTLNPKELSPEVCKEIIQFAASLPLLKQVSMDSRESFITTDYSRELAGILGPDKLFRIILGIESADDRIRNQLLNKKMPKRMIERAVCRFRTAWEEADMDIRQAMAAPGLSVNVVIGAPGTTEATVDDDVLETANYAVKLSEKYSMPVDLNLHPYYPSRRSLSRFPDHRRVSPYRVKETLTMLKQVIGESDKIVFFLGLQDEHHDQEQQQRAEDLVLYNTNKKVPNENQ